MSAPWDCITPDQWRRLFGEAFVLCQFDLDDLILDAGLTPEQAEGLKAWCRHADFEDDVRQTRQTMSPSTLRFIEELERDGDGESGTGDD